MSQLTTSKIGEYTLVGDTYFKHGNAYFSHVGDGDTLVYKDCDGNFAELYHDEGDNIVTISDLDKDAAEDILPDLSFCDVSQDGVDHLLSLGFPADNLPDAKLPAVTKNARGLKEVSNG